MQNSSLNQTGSIGLYCTVFITGAAVMVIELLGTRMIAPFYGTSLYVWSSLISVTMIALACGYFSGGRLADRQQRLGLSLIIALAGLAILLIPWLTRPVLLATDPLGLRLGAFTSALILFFPGLLFLGMIGPFAIKLGTAHLEAIGKSTGSIYAVSTFGSVFGTLFLGFFLFPLLGSREILIGTALLLLLLAVAIALYEQKKLGIAHAVLPCIIILALSLSCLPKIVSAGYSDHHQGKFSVLSERESLYGWVRVVEEPARDLRFLTSDASMIGAASITTGQTAMGYQKIVGMIPGLTGQMHQALIIGLGAGHMSKTLFDQYGVVTDTLEIDPAVATAATDFFHYQPTGRAIVGDARYEIRHLQGPYDLIIHDCFTGGSEPSHLLTVETLQQLKGLMSSKGILALNFVSFAHKPQTSLASVAKTLAQVFPQLTLFIAEPGEDFNDFIFLASNEAIDLNSSTLQPQQAAWLQQRVFQVNSAEGQMLTDNFNPLDHLQTAKAEQYRHVLVDWFGAELLVR